MENNKYLDEEAEKLFREKSNAKIKQKIELLKMDKSFLKDVRALRKKYAVSTKEYESCLKQIFNKFCSEIMPRLNAITKEDQKRFKPLALKAFEPLKNKGFNKDAVDLCKKYKLYPIEHWKYPVLIFTAIGKFFPPDYWFLTGLKNYLPRKELFNKPAEINFALKIKTNKATKDKVLFAQIFENTTSKDIKKNWSIIEKYQKKLKEEKGIKKRFYPLKNLEKIKKLETLRRKGKSDWEIQEEIFGEIKNINFGKEEKKRKNALQQALHQHKKRLKS